MNQVREIVTKAVVAKGKKTVKIQANIKTDSPIYSILGCMVINNKFVAIKEKDLAIVRGSFELNIWNSKQGNTETSVIKEIVYYEENVKTKQLINDFISGDDDIIVKITAHPICKDVRIKDDEIIVDVEFEIVADVIGETKIQVSILDNVEVFVDEEDFTQQINQDFIGKN